MSISFNKTENDSFWKWFATVSKTLRFDMTNTNILAELDNKVRRLGKFDWEIGPFDQSTSYLAISPNLDANLLPVTAEIVNSAPALANWVFLDAKPKKEYIPSLNLLNEHGDKITIDTSNWMYTLYYFEDRTFDIDIKVEHFNGNINTQKLAVDIVLTNILGEEKFLKFFKNVKIINDVSLDSTSMTPIKYLDQHTTTFLDKVNK